MGSRLRNIKKTAKLGGKGKLTDVLIKKLTTYYGLAIQRNSESKDMMRKEIMATYYHSISTDEKPQHQFCPTGVDTWCAYNIAQSKNMPYTHKDPLHPDVQTSILPIYEDLSRDDLLERCVGGFTQNANESFNSTIWRLAPKHLHCGSKIIEIAAYLVAGIFNDGYSFILKVMNDLELQIGKECQFFANDYDAHRVQRQNRRSLSSSKEARTARKGKKTAEMDDYLEIEDPTNFVVHCLDDYLEIEGLLYGPGIAE
ncbi:hypothetical protein ALC60_14160 [Trachymyrmex zeteki]|uniref:Mutator-like transposase domain-containing protein n=1 Tax=Mycetomoellerius zeteki TaxID=64791 RepID=A0A151WGA9_9HYME|nr:hypothetical protein ALC60_14160 [Trachymyrmex zeteki]